MLGSEDGMQSRIKNRSSDSGHHVNMLHQTHATTYMLRIKCYRGYQTSWASNVLGTNVLDQTSWPSTYTLACLIREWICPTNKLLSGSYSLADDGRMDCGQRSGLI
jgi:hypothetical protein